MTTAKVWRSWVALAAAAALLTASQGAVASYLPRDRGQYQNLYSATSAVTTAASGKATPTATHNTAGAGVRAVVATSSTSAVVKPTTTAGSNSTSLTGKVATAWYPGWLASTHPLESLSWDKYNMMTFSFATTTPDPAVFELDSESQALLPKFVQLAKQNNVKALLSLGGWTGSRYFSTATGTAANRTTATKAILGLVEKYNLDGIDFDWEFPNEQSTGCNVYSTSDSANFLSLLKELRQDPVGAKLVLTAATGVQPWLGADGTPLTDVKAFSEVLDFIAIMAYDIWGAWSPTTGPNAPLDDSCATTKAGSGKAAVEAWSAANFPVDQIVLGVPAYGRSYYVDASNAFTDSSQKTLTPYATFDKTRQPLGEGEVAGTTPDICGTATGPSGQFTFGGLINAGFLTKNGTAASGITYTFDQCSQTPFLYNKASSVMVSYDDTKSFAAKGKYIADTGLGGFAMWHAAGDSNGLLVNAVKQAMGS